MIQTIQVQGRRYYKTVENLRAKILLRTEQSLVSENTLSTNSCKHQYKYLFWNHLKLLQKIAQYKHTHISVRLLCFSDEKTTRFIMPYSKLLLNDCKVEKTFIMTKFPIFHSYPTVYYFPHFDKLFQKIAIKIKFDHIEIRF